MQMSKTKWVRPNRTNEDVQGLEFLREINVSGNYGLSDSVVEFLFNRGVKTREDLEDILETGSDRELDPYDLKDMDKAVEALQRIIKEDKKVIIYGDYDADGVSATVIAIQALRNLGLEVDYYINNRFVEGYGISPLGVDNMLLKHPDAEVVITVDNGIVAFEGVKYAQEKGMEVLITDHHLALEAIPEALAVVCPARHDDTSFFKEVCGATVIYKVMLALYWELGEDLEFITNMIDLVGMATVGDVMPLMSENRFYVNEALRLIEKNTRKQFEILKLKRNIGVLNEEVFGFQFVPTINAVGRLHGTPTLAVDFFLTEDEMEMNDLADQLIDINDERKAITAEQEALAEELLEGKQLGKVIIVAHPDFHVGIVGLVAGRLKEKYNRPTIVFTQNGDLLTGSARSIEGFHIKNGLDEMKPIILKHGGHALAAGLTIHESKLNVFKDAMEELSEEELTEEDLIEKIVVDAVLTPEDVTLDLIAEIDSLRPFGQGFQSPVFGLKDFKVDRAIFMGAEKNHLKLVNQASELELVMFKHAEDYKSLGEPKHIKALGSPKINSFRGKITIQFSVEGNCLAY